jgi:hypothetical protein
MVFVLLQDNLLTKFFVLLMRPRGYNLLTKFFVLLMRLRGYNPLTKFFVLSFSICKKISNLYKRLFYLFRKFA